eukprot:3640566-Amphidinium_carterae.3
MVGIGVLGKHLCEYEARAALVAIPVVTRVELSSCTSLTATANTSDVTMQRFVALKAKLWVAIDIYILCLHRELGFV